MPDSDVHYAVTLDPKRHEMTVAQMIAGAAATRPIRLFSPSFVPGDYEFQPYGRDVLDLRAESADGTPVSLRRLGWQGYEISDGDGDVRLSYRAAAASVDFSEACGILDDRYGVLLGTRYR